MTQVVSRDDLKPSPEGFSLSMLIEIKINIGLYKYIELKKAH